MQTSDRQNQPLKIAARGAFVGIVVYLIISSLKLGAAYFVHSASLRADGLNNLTDIISSILIFIGLRIARKPADEDHYFGHSKFEPLASFATSLIMFTVGLEVIKSSAGAGCQCHFTRHPALHPLFSPANSKHGPQGQCQGSLQ